ncbi:MAG: phage tail assembly protein [Qipengyuania pacifica]
MTETTTSVAKPSSFETVDLAEPIKRGETTIDKLQLRKPKAGELRGLALSDVIGLDISAILKLLPRITEPALTDHECAGLDPADLTECGGAIRGFFMTASERRMLEAMIAEQQPTT